MKSIVIDLERNNVILVGDGGTIPIGFSKLSPVELSKLNSFITEIEKYDSPVLKTLKKATLNGSIVVILSNDDKIVSKSLTDLNPLQVAPLNELLSMISREQTVDEITYTKATNVMCINGVEMPASNLGATSLLDRIEAVCLELLNM